MTPEEQAANRFIAFHRGRRRRPASTYRPDPMLSVWCAWEAARDSLAVDVASSLAKGYAASAEVDVAGFKVADERMVQARERYLAAERARRAAS